METVLTLKTLGEQASYELQETKHIYTGEKLMYGGLTMDLTCGDYLSK